METIDHVDGYVEHLGAEGAPLDEARLAEVVRLTKKSGAWIVPTMALWETLLGVSAIEKLVSYPELKYMPAQEVAAWEKAHRARQAAPQFDRRKAELTAANRKRILKGSVAGISPRFIIRASAHPSLSGNHTREAYEISVQVAPLRAHNHPSLCPLVLQIPAFLSRP